jgi:predicted nucleic acid-binding protein
VLEWLPRLARKRKLNLALLLATFQSLPIRWADARSYGLHEDDARRGMAGRDEDDWPTVALALSLAGSYSAAVWSQDKDFEVSGLDLMTTGSLLDLLEGRA